MESCPHKGTYCKIFKFRSFILTYNFCICCFCTVRTAIGRNRMTQCRMLSSAYYTRVMRNFYIVDTFMSYEYINKHDL